MNPITWIADIAPWADSRWQVQNTLHRRFDGGRDTANEQPFNLEQNARRKTFRVNKSRIAGRSVNGDYFLPAEIRSEEFLP